MTPAVETWWSVRRERDELGKPLRLDPDRIETAAAAVDVMNAAALRRLIERLAVPASCYYRGDRPVIGWPAPFYPYQAAGITALLERDALLLADDMGLGKTVQAIAALRIMVRRRAIARALIIAPAGLLPQWRRTLRDWAPDLRVSTVHGSATERAWQWKTPAHVTLTSYETVRADFTNNPQSPPRRTQWGVVVLDEAQKIKNREADLSRVCKQLPRDRAWALTGTPLENRLDDLASICEFLTPWTSGVPLPRLDPGAQLLARHASLQLRRKKGNVLAELPPKLINDVRLSLTPEQRRAYDDAERRGVIWLRELGANVRITHVLELITRLKQICNVCPRTGRSAKLDDLVERVSTVVEQGEKALVFSQYTDDRFGIASLARQLDQFAPLSYTGEIDMFERARVIAEFQRRCGGAVLLLSLRAGGQGLNLQDASYVFHFDRWWNPAVERQAEDRTHRLGQMLPVTVYRYLCEHTIEERIDELVREKQWLFEQVVDDVSLETGLTARELFGLFGLQQPAARP